MAIGEPQTLSFQGQATHGGGSCQISLSTDKQPTKDSVFKVIYSIEGGCPSKNPGNVGVNPFGYGADKFQYSIPPEISPGDYTLACKYFLEVSPSPFSVLLENNRLTQLLQGPGSTKSARGRCT